MILTGSPTPLPLTTTLMLPDMIRFYGIRTICGVRVQKITPQSVEFSADAKADSVDCDTVILSTGYRADDSLYRKAVQALGKNI